MNLSLNNFNYMGRMCCYYDEGYIEYVCVHFIAKMLLDGIQYRLMN